MPGRSFRVQLDQDSIKILPVLFDLRADGLVCLGSAHAFATVNSPVRRLELLSPDSRASLQITQPSKFPENLTVETVWNENSLPGGILEIRWMGFLPSLSVGIPVVTTKVAPIQENSAQTFRRAVQIPPSSAGATMPKMSEVPKISEK
ncbi:hypothetical protein PoB_006960600 [Plakobranchus ocellatus]|uniref:Uncharacterized protein n=1 Tax=Plakobranchus ocellatus TaxID=259542 RepID=A0AAV4DG01_9GAST|nr:hypothetical protein PoB_006960600 [Plakobranchus ocellatus]